MSKVDAMRALREARHAAADKAAPPRPARAASPAVKSPPSTAVEPAVEPDEALCGHRNMGGKSCTRERDHVQNGTKNHRYG